MKKGNRAYIMHLMIKDASDRNSSCSDLSQKSQQLNAGMKNTCECSSQWLPGPALIAVLIGTFALGVVINRIYQRFNSGLLITSENLRKTQTMLT